VIYFVVDRAANAVKIGYSLDLAGAHRRLSTFQIGNPRELTLAAAVPGDMYTESLLHRQYQALRIRGEWYEFLGELREYVEQLRNYCNDTTLAS